MNLLYDFLDRNQKRFVFLTLKLYWALIFILTTLPGHTLPKNLKLSDKVEHMLAYFGLAFLLAFALHFKNKQIKLSKIFLYVILITTAYAGFDELHQMLIPFRSAEWLDFLADIIGSIIGATTVLYFIYFVRKNDWQNS